MAGNTGDLQPRELSAADDNSPSIDLDSRQKRQHRSWFAIIGGGLTVFIVVSTAFLFAADGAGFIPFTVTPFHVSDGLFQTYIYSAFGSVIALGLTITKSLFPGEGGWFASILEAFGRGRD